MRPNKTLTKIGGLFVIVLGICLFLAILFRPDLKTQVEIQWAKRAGLTLKIQSHRTHLFPPSITLYQVRTEGTVSCQIPEIQIDFSWLSAFQKNKTINRLTLKNPTCSLSGTKQKNTDGIQNLLKGNFGTFPIEIQNATFSSQAQPTLTLNKVNLTLTESADGMVANGVLSLRDKPFRTRFRITPLQAAGTWAAAGTASHDKNTFFNFSFKFLPQRTQGFFNFSLPDVPSFLGIKGDAAALSMLSHKTEGSISIDFSPQQRDFPLFIVRTTNKDIQTAFTGHLSWQYNPKDTQQNALTGEVVIKELSGPVKEAFLAHLNWQTADALKYFRKIDLAFIIQRLPLGNSLLKNITLKLHGTGRQLFITNGYAEFPGNERFSFDGFFEAQQKEPRLKLRFDGRTSNIRPFLSALPWSLTQVPQGLLKRLSFNGTLQLTPQQLGLEMTQLDVDDVKLSGRLNCRNDGKEVYLKANVQNLNLDTYTHTLRAEGAALPFDQVPAQIARWIADHWIHTASVFDVDITAENSLYLNMPVDRFTFVGKLQDDTWRLQNFKAVNLAGLNIDGAGAIHLSGQNQLDIPAEFSLKLSSQQLPIFLQRARIAPEKAKEILFDGSISAQNKVLTAVGVWQFDADPYEKIEKQFNY